jgi:hypothetical protein
MVAEHQRERPPSRPDPSRPDPARPNPGRSEAEVATAGPRTIPAAESVAPGRARRPVTVRGAVALQRQAGNRAVSRLIANPAAPAQQPAGGRPATAHEDPKFAALTGDVSAKRRTLTSHPPATSAAAAAQAAAVAPADDKQAQGKAAQAEKMNAAKPGEFDKAAFVAAVNAAISAQAPKNLEEADDFAGSGKADVVKGQVAGKVAGGKQASAAAIEGATKAPPDTSAAKTKPVTPLPPDRPPATPAAPDANKAVPDPAPAAATDFSAGPKQVDAEMAEAGVTEKQLKADPEFEGALTAKKEAEQHSATAPGKVRASEAETLAAAKAQARMSGATAMTAMTGDRTRSGAGVQQGQQGTKSADEKRRAEATARLQKVFDATKAEIEAMLAGLDKTVDEQFTREEKQARDAFTAEHKQKMEAYKDERYSGWRGKARWVRDKFAGLPSEANQIFVTARAGYVNRMQGVISRIADTIGTTLGKAKARIAQGRTELQAEVQKLPADLQKFGRSAAAEFAGRFDELTESVNAKSTELVQTLASKYSEAMKSVDEEIEAEKEANKGFVAKAVDAVKGAIKTIMALKDLLLNVLAKAASAVMTIIKDPIGFLGNLISAVGSGLKSFISNIGTHLKNGLVGWLMGAMASTGLQLPAKFDLKGIIGMIASLLGLTWNAIRGRIVSRGVPDQAVTAVEEAEPLAQKLKGEGVGGIWETIVERVGDLKDKLLSKISEYLIPTVLIAGITWLISLLNPASAFIKACKMIIDFITFIVERGAQIAAFVNSVLDAVIAIAGGGGGGVGALIEKALAGSIPVLIGALAAFLGIGGIANKVKAFFQSLSKPVMKAVDWVADKLVKFGKKIWGKLKAAGKKLKDKATAKGRATDKGAAATSADKERSARPGRDPRVRELAIADLGKVFQDGISDAQVRPALGGVMAARRSQGLSLLEASQTPERPGYMDLYLAASPKEFIRTVRVNPADRAARELMENGQPYPEPVFGMKDLLVSGKTTFPDAGEQGYTEQTFAIATLHFSSRVLSFEKVGSKSGKHAEAIIVDDIAANWEQYRGDLDTQTPAGEPHATLHLKTTRTPCVGCTARLRWLRMQAAQRGIRLRIEVDSMALHQGRAELSQGSTISAQGKKKIVETGPAIGARGLRTLMRSGIPVRVMDVTDPSIQDPLKAMSAPDRAVLLARIAKWNATLAQAILGLSPPNVTVKS